MKCTNVSNRVLFVRGESEPCETRDRVQIIPTILRSLIPDDLEQQQPARLRRDPQPASSHCPNSLSAISDRCFWRAVQAPVVASSMSWSKLLPERVTQMTCLIVVLQRPLHTIGRSFRELSTPVLASIGKVCFPQVRR